MSPVPHKILCQSRIHRHALWIMGEYANNKQDILDVMEEIKKGLGDVRFVVKISDNWINFVYPMALLEVDNN